VTHVLSLFLTLHTQVLLLPTQFIGLDKCQLLCRRLLEIILDLRMLVLVGRALMHLVVPLKFSLTGGWLAETFLVVDLEA